MYREFLPYGTPGDNWHLHSGGNSNADTNQMNQAHKFNEFLKKHGKQVRQFNVVSSQRQGPYKYQYMFLGEKNTIDKGGNTWRNGLQPGDPTATYVNNESWLLWSNLQNNAARVAENFKDVPGYIAENCLHTLSLCLASLKSRTEDIPGGRTSVSYTHLTLPTKA